MTDLRTTLRAAIVPGTFAGCIALRWPRVDLVAPAASSDTTVSEAPRHRRFVADVNSRLPAKSSSAVSPAVTVVLIIATAARVGIPLAMIRTLTGVAEWDEAANIYARAHAKLISHQALRELTHLRGTWWIVPLSGLVPVVKSIRQRSSAVVNFLTLVVGRRFLVTNVSRTLVDRALPRFDHLTGSIGPSFPSGTDQGARRSFDRLGLDSHVLSRFRGSTFNVRVVRGPRTRGSSPITKDVAPAKSEEVNGDDA